MIYPFKKHCFYTLCAVVFTFTCTINAQVPGASPTINEQIIIGSSLQNDTEIIARTVQFSDSIVHFEISPQGKDATLKIRKKGLTGYDQDTYEDILIYDLKNDSILWQKKYDFRHTIYIEDDTMLIKTFANSSSRINPKTGQKIWSKQGANYGMDINHGLGFMYTYRKLHRISSMLEGINIYTGETLWTRKIKHKSGWSGVSSLSDSLSLVISDGLHTVNLKTGQGWDYAAYTGYIDQSRATTIGVAAFAFGIIGAMVANSIVPPTPIVTHTSYIDHYNLLFKDLCSNTLISNENVFFASNDRVAKLNLNTGEVIWEQFHFGKAAGTSDIFFANGNLITLSTGAGLLRGTTTYYHTPFVEAVDTSKGNLVYSNTYDYRSEFITDYLIQGSELILFFNGHIAKMNLDDGTIIKEIDIGEPSVNKLHENKAIIKVADNHLILESDSFAFTEGHPSNLIYVLSDKGTLWLLDTDQMTTRKNPEGVVIFESKQLGRYQFAISDNTTFLLDERNKPLAYLKMSNRAVIHGDFIYDVQGDKFIIINVNQL